MRLPVGDPAQGPGEGGGPGPTGGENAYAAYGRAVHIGLEAELGPDWDYEVWIDGNNRVDALNWDTRTVVELKPDNPRAIRNGIAQGERYVKILEEQTGEKWTFEVMRYQRYLGPH